MGADCKRGEHLVVSEMTDPKRIVTGTIKTTIKGTPALSVKTDGKIAKSDVMKVMQILRGVTVNDYKYVGDVVVENVLGSGVNIVATMDMRRNEK